MYGPADENESIATIHAAIDRGVTLLDTGDFYGMGHNEMLIGRALEGRRGQVLLSVKFGALRGPDGSWLGFDSRPAAVKNFLAHSLTRLRTDHIDIYRPSRLDGSVPIEETVGAIADMVKAGYVRAIGLSEVGVETIRRAHAVHPICDLQIEYSLISRGPEARIFPALRELGIGVTAYGVLSRGLLTGSPLGPRRFARPHAAFRGRKSGAQPEARRDAERSGRRKRRGARATGHRLGAGQGFRHRPGNRRAHPEGSSTNRWARWPSSSRPRKSRAWRRPSRRPRWPARATPSSRCGCSTASKLASKAAMLLMGKTKPSYTPFLDTGDHVIVINADKVRVTGRKETDKLYRHFTGYPGGLVEKSLQAGAGRKARPPGGRRHIRHASQNQARQTDVSQIEGVRG
jgi:aryl-alcohol dehydrogenase-like predicted oxidoreductase